MDGFPRRAAAPEGPRLGECRTRPAAVSAVGHDPAVDELVTPGGLRLDGAALTWRVTRSGGPGGQHANTSDTSVIVTVHLPDAGLAEADTARLVAALGPTVTARSSDSRSQWRNRQLAWERLAARLDGAARPPRPRATRPARRSPLGPSGSTASAAGRPSSRLAAARPATIGAERASRYVCTIAIFDATGPRTYRRHTWLTAVRCTPQQELTSGSGSSTVGSKGGGRGSS